MEERVQALEKARRDIEDTLVVMAEVQRRQAEVQRDQAENLAQINTNLLRFSEKMLEMEDKLNGLIGYLDQRDRPSAEPS